MFSKYFQSELTYLRELGREFAQANPTVAGMLAEKSGDPDVERLLEGFAFLTARIRERIDDDVPEVIHSLTELLLPHYLRTVPAATIVEFTPNVGALRGRYTVPAGAELASSPVDGTPCLFRTTTDVELLPLTLLETSLDTAVANAPVLRLQFQTTEASRPVVFEPRPIRLFIQGEYGFASTLLLWIARYCREVTVRGASGRARAVALGAGSVHTCGMDPADAMLPWPRMAPAGFRLVQEFFTLPNKFLFFELSGLEAAADVAEERFEVALRFERPPALPARVGRETLRLHCAPAINLFRTDASPLRLDVATHEYMLRPAEVDPRHAEVYSVDSVVGLQSGRAERKVYRSFFEFGHAAPAAVGEAERAFYRVRRTTSPIDDGIDAYLSIGTPRDAPSSRATGEETLSIELTCTNRSAPATLRLGEVSVVAPGSPTVARFRNIVPVSKPARPALGSELHWRLISHLVVNQRSLAEASVLRTALELYNFQEIGDRVASRANRLRAEGVREVTMQSLVRLFGGIPVRGAGTTIELEEARYAGEGDAFLFGAVVNELFAAAATLNTFNELTVRLHPSQAEYKWPAKSGRQPIL